MSATEEYDGDDNGEVEQAESTAEFKPVVELPTDVHVTTGEEDDEVVFKEYVDFSFSVVFMFFRPRFVFSSKFGMFSCSSCEILLLIHFLTAFTDCLFSKFRRRCKLHRFAAESKEWKERGTGDVRLMKNKVNGMIRVVMRQEKTNKLVLNHFGMKLFVFNSLITSRSILLIRRHFNLIDRFICCFVFMISIHVSAPCCGAEDQPG
jgi:hypothetical protein